MLHGALASHRRGRVLQEALSASVTAELPPEGSVVVMFGEEFQSAPTDRQSKLIEWTRTAGRVLLLLPPFSATACDRPVPWRTERLESLPRGGEGIATLLAGEVGYRLIGSLQAPPLPGATWSDLSLCVGTYRLHAAAGLFVATCLPLWSLAVLDATAEVEAWLDALAELAGEAPAIEIQKPKELLPDHYGLLVFLLSKSFKDEAHAFTELSTSPIFRLSLERARSLLKELQDQGLVGAAVPTAEAHALVMESPYALYVNPVREVSK